MCVIVCHTPQVTENAMKTWLSRRVVFSYFWKVSLYNIHTRISKLLIWLTVSWFNVLKCRRKSFLFPQMWKSSTKVQKRLGALFMLYVLPTQNYTCTWTLPYRQDDSLKWVIKVLLKHTFYETRKSLGSEWTSFLYIRLLSADNICKQFGPKSEPTECWSWSGFCRPWSESKLFDTLMVFLIFFFKKVNF